MKGYREANPIEDGDTNTAVNTMYEKMFDLLEKMIGENDIINGRPNWDNVGKGFTKLLEMVSPYYQERRLLLV